MIVVEHIVLLVAATDGDGAAHGHELLLGGVDLSVELLERSADRSVESGELAHIESSGTSLYPYR
jgi:hypothetical protein